MSANRPVLERLTTGTVAFDRILGGGLPTRSVNIIAAQPGVGKTREAEITGVARLAGRLRLAVGADPRPRGGRHRRAILGGGGGRRLRGASSRLGHGRLVLLLRLFARG